MRKSFFSLVVWMPLAGWAAALGCSAPDPGVGYLGPAPSLNGGAGGQWDSGSSTGSTSGASDAGADGAPTGGGGGGDGGGATGGDAGAATGPSSFLGEATPWVSAPVAVSARTRHADVGQIRQAPTTVCLECHGGASIAKTFLAGGFVATKANGSVGASDVEVRLVDKGTGDVYTAHTDADGFFWITPPDAGVTGPFNAGCRDGTDTSVMISQPPNADCQTTSCHGGTTGVVHLP